MIEQAVVDQFEKIGVVDLAVFDQLQGFEFFQSAVPLQADELERPLKTLLVGGKPDRSKTTFAQLANEAVSEDQFAAREAERGA